MKKTSSKRRQRRKQKDRLENFGKFLIIGLLMLALYIYDFNSRYAGTIHYGDGTPNPQTSAVVHFIDVGQADAACIVLPGGEVLLIDAGCNASEDKLISYLAKYKIKHIDYAVFTHPHEDHIGGADAVFNACSIDHVLIPDVAAATSTYEILLECIEAEECSVQYAVPGNTYILGDASFSVLGPLFSAEDNLNNASILLSFRYKDTTFLFTGDAEADAESAALFRDPAALNADVLKVGHHGSSTSSSELFLAAVSPDVAVISCGEYNEYGHPHAVTLNRLGLYTNHIFRTDQLGSIRIYSDGTTLLVQSDKSLNHE